MTTCKCTVSTATSTEQRSCFSCKGRYVQVGMKLYFAHHATKQGCHLKTVARGAVLQEVCGP